MPQTAVADITGTLTNPAIIPARLNPTALHGTPGRLTVLPIDLRVIGQMRGLME